jgi:hypothetical protein
MGDSLGQFHQAAFKLVERMQAVHCPMDIAFSGNDGIATGITIFNPTW